MFSFLFVVPLYADISCSDNGDCPAGMYCSPDSVCGLDPNTFASYAEISAELGEHSPGKTVGKRYVSPSAKRITLGQLMLHVKTPGETKKVYTRFSSVAVKKQASSKKIQLSEMSLIFDKNGNGSVDTGEPVWSDSVDEDSGVVRFAIADEFKALKQGDYNVIFTGAIGYDEATIPLNQLVAFKINDKALIDITARDSVAVIEPDITFPTLMLIPSGKVLVFSEGEHNPTAPTWEHLDGEVAVLHMSIMASGGNISFSSFTIKTVGNSVKFGPFLPSVMVYEDTDNDGKGDVLLGTITGFTETSFARFKPTTGTMSVKQDTTRNFVIAVDMRLISGQYAQFSVGDVESDVTVIGSSVSSDVFKYNCTEKDEGCRLAESQGSSSGCSVLMVR